jgi:hypothetical protein
MNFPLFPRKVRQSYTTSEGQLAAREIELINEAKASKIIIPLRNAAE